MRTDLARLLLVCTWCAMALTGAIAAGCAPTASMSCANKLEVFKNQLQWNTPGVSLPADVRSAIDQAENAIAAGDDAACDAAIDALSEQPGVG